MLGFPGRIDGARRPRLHVDSRSLLDQSTGILLAVTIIYQYYEMFSKEQGELQAGML